MTLLRKTPVFLVFLLATSLLAGCLGGDDDIDTDDDTNGGTDGTTGSVTGRVLTTNLREINGARVAIVDDGELVKEGNTDSNGNYQIRGIEPGDYRLQVTAACCREDVRAIQVAAGQTLQADIQLAPFTQADLQQPFVDEQQWNGFLSCALGTPVIVAALCSFADGTPVEDPNEEFLLHFDIGAGLKTIVVGMEWEAAGGVLGNDLQIIVENEGCGATQCSQEYGQAAGPSPLLVYADSPGGEWAYSEIDEGETRTLQFRVFPDFQPNVFYQQAFTVHYHLFYHAAAPEGYDPIPDN